MGSGLVYPFYRDSRTSERNDGSCRRGSRWNANRYASSDGRKDGWSRHDGWRRRHDEQGHERHDERPEKVIQSQLDERRFYARSDRLRGRKSNSGKSIWSYSENEGRFGRLLDAGKGLTKRSIRNGDLLWCSAAPDRSGLIFQLVSRSACKWCSKPSGGVGVSGRNVSDDAHDDEGQNVENVFQSLDQGWFRCSDRGRNDRPARVRFYARRPLYPVSSGCQTSAFVHSDAVRRQSGQACRFSGQGGACELLGFLVRSLQGRGGRPRKRLAEIQGPWRGFSRGQHPEQGRGRSRFHERVRAYLF